MAITKDSLVKFDVLGGNVFAKVSEIFVLDFEVVGEKVLASAENPIARLLTINQTEHTVPVSALTEVTKEDFDAASFEFINILAGFLGIEKYDTLKANITSLSDELQKEKADREAIAKEIEAVRKEYAELLAKIETQDELSLIEKRYNELAEVEGLAVLGSTKEEINTVLSEMSDAEYDRFKAMAAVAFANKMVKSSEEVVNDATEIVSDAVGSIQEEAVVNLASLSEASTDNLPGLVEKLFSKKR